METTNQYMTKEMKGIYLVQYGIDALIDFFDKGEVAKKEQRDQRQLEMAYLNLCEHNEIVMEEQQKEKEKREKEKERIEKEKAEQKEKDKEKKKKKKEGKKKDKQKPKAK